MGLWPCVDYQCCISWNYLSPVKISSPYHAHNSSYALFRFDGFLCNAIYAIHILPFMSWVVCFHWNDENVEPNANYSRFGAGGNDNPPPPPPPHGIAEVLAAQTEILRQLVQTQQQQRGGHHAHKAQEASYQDFLSTQPPRFTKADEPLDADA